MKNLVNYNQDCFAVFEAALKKKQDPNLKKRLEPIKPTIATAFTVYNNAFNINGLEGIAQNAAFNAFAEDLKCLYKYNSATIRNLKKTIDDLQPYYLSNTCQNCTINSVNSMDHLLAQSLFPQYCVHPLNLFPSCTECNGYKSASFTKHGRRRFLNLYSDQLPHTQYLFLKVFNNKHGLLDYSFELRNPGNQIDPNLFDLIESHFQDLHLFIRMKTSSIKFYGELRNTVKSRLQDVSWEVMVRQIKREATDNMNNLGRNHYIYVLQTGMIDSDLFEDTFAENG